MKEVIEIHPAQLSILRTLRHLKSARYTDLRHPTALDSDIFKFHLRKLVNQKFIEKQSNGDYLLTIKGKEFANNLSKIKPTIQKQPKLSVAIVARKQTSNGRLYLFQKRYRNPFYGYWSTITGPVQWGQPFEETAKYEFEKQTGLSATYEVKFFHRKTDFNEATGEILEDKLFAVLEAKDLKGLIDNKWSGGLNAWMSLDELEKQHKHFNSLRDLISALNQGKKYSCEKAFYSESDY
jgi:predicted transcriptional regulator/ADP-ribose pyrophosphatase YjhB (NUDIX family)